MVTFTTLAESKCDDPLSEQVTPAPGASTHTATVEERPRRAAWMSRASAAATAGCDVDVHATAGVVRLGPAGLALAAGAPGASSAANDPSSATAPVASSRRRDLPPEARSGIFPPPSP